MHVFGHINMYYLVFKQFEFELMNLIHFIYIGYALAHGPTMVKELVGFMLAIVMKPLSKREW